MGITALGEAAEELHVHPRQSRRDAAVLHYSVVELCLQLPYKVAGLPSAAKIFPTEENDEFFAADCQR